MTIRLHVFFQIQRSLTSRFSCVFVKLSDPQHRPTSIGHRFLIHGLIPRP